MDNQMLISMMGSNITTRDTKGSTKSGDANMFSQAFEEATSGSQIGSDESQEVISEKSTPKTEAEKRNAEAKDAQAQAKAAQQAKVAQDPKTIGSRAYLYQIMYKNPDAMSLAEKQALKLDSANTGVGLRELRTMMSERGVSMRDLSFTQMATLTRSNSHANVNEFLEALTKETKGQTKDDSQTGTKSVDAGMASSSSAKTDGKAAPDNTLAAAAIRQADQAAPTQQANAVMKRKQVIDQIVTHMELRNFANRDELQLKLNPEYLGELKIQLTRGESGEVSAKFITTSDETREVLSESKTELRKRVEEKGLRFGNIDVDLVEELA